MRRAVGFARTDENVSRHSIPYPLLNTYTFLKSFLSAQHLLVLVVNHPRSSNMDRERRTHRQMDSLSDSLSDRKPLIRPEPAADSRSISAVNSHLYIFFTKTKSRDGGSHLISTLQHRDADDAGCEISATAAAPFCGWLACIPTLCTTQFASARETCSWPGESVAP